MSPNIPTSNSLLATFLILNYLTQKRWNYRLKAIGSTHPFTPSDDFPNSQKCPSNRNNFFSSCTTIKCTTSRGKNRKFLRFKCSKQKTCTCKRARKSKNGDFSVTGENANVFLSTIYRAYQSNNFFVKFLRFKLLKRRGLQHRPLLQKSLSPLLCMRCSLAKKRKNFILFIARRESMKSGGKLCGKKAFEFSR